MENGFGPHLMLDLSECDEKKLVDFDFLFSFLDDMPGKVGMSKITTPFIRPWLDKWAKTPGYSGFVMLAESHITFHTFPDSKFVFVDLFSCRDFDVQKTIKYIVDAFGSKKYEEKIVNRGNLFDSQPE